MLPATGPRESTAVKKSSVIWLICAISDAVKLFEVSDIGRSPTRFDQAKLTHNKGHNIPPNHEAALVAAARARVNAVAGVSYGVIHPPLRQVSTAVSALVETRGAIVACHEACVVAKTQIPGLRTVSWGDGDDQCPEIATTELRIVA